MANQVVAVDGPSASGKSTVARTVAQKLGWLYVDSGALYRAVTWRALQEGRDTSNFPDIAEFVKTVRMGFQVTDIAVSFTVDGVSLNAELRTEEINIHVSPVAANPDVRERVVAWLRSMLEFGDLVMEGRDIGTAVFPDTPHKFYLDASPEERARRRHAEMHGDEDVHSVEDVGRSLRRRDTIDSGRKKDPLKIAPGALVIDSTSLTVDQVGDLIVAAVREQG